MVVKFRGLCRTLKFREAKSNYYKICKPGCYQSWLKVDISVLVVFKETEQKVTLNERRKVCEKYHLIKPRMEGRSETNTKVA